MKNYSKKKEDTKRLILNYEVIADEIIVNYANGEVDIIPYSTKAEIKILKKMKLQLLRYNSFLNSLHDKFSVLLKLLIDELLMLVLFITIIATFEIPLIATIVGTISFPIVISLTAHKLVECQKRRNDIKEKILFLDSEESLFTSTKIKSPKNKELDIKSKDNKSVVTFNAMEGMEYTEMQQEYDNIEQELNKDKVKVLSKKRKIADRK